MSLDYIKLNKDSWDKRVATHFDSAFYAMDEFMKGHTSLNEIELSILGDIKDKSVLHLQCHFGQDTLSLSRMGAKCTGVDFSGEAISKARELNAKLGLDCDFICSDIYELPKQLDKKFDIVFASYGTIGWLPDMDRWAEIVSHFLKDSGIFVFVEFHPVVWMFDEHFGNIGYNYFNAEPIIESTTGTYAEKGSEIKHETISWNHNLAEVINALLHSGLKLQSFMEYDYSPYNCFNGMEKTGEKKFRIKHLGNKIPLVYSIKAIKEHS
jgi:SAM-dependent methyltransferase